MKIDFTELLKAQKELDQVIIGDKKIEDIEEKKLVALSIETSELLNEIRSFKYWSNKGPSENTIILDEMADCIHFWLSIINDIGIKNVTIKSSEIFTLFSINELYLHMQKMLFDFDKTGHSLCLKKYMEFILKIAKILNFTEKEIIEAYYKKRDINFKRQQEGY